MPMRCLTQPTLTWNSWLCSLSMRWGPKLNCCQKKFGGKKMWGSTSSDLIEEMIWQLWAGGEESNDLGFNISVIAQVFLPCEEIYAIYEQPLWNIWRRWLITFRNRRNNINYCNVNHSVSVICTLKKLIVLAKIWKNINCCEKFWINFN